MKKNYLYIFIACLLPLAALAQTWQIGSPNAGDLTASLNKGVLTLSGTGTTQNYSVNTGMAPWFAQKDAITTVIIEEGISGIGQLIFQNHSSLTAVLLPSSLSTIGSLAFQNCTALTEIIVQNPVPPTGSGQYPFSGVTVKNCLLIVPKGSEAAYRGVAVWRDFNIAEEGTVPMLCSPSVSGKFGEDEEFMWYVCNNTTLAIRGEGYMPDFEFPTNNGDSKLFTPWFSQIQRTIKTIVIQEGVTSIGYAAVPFSFSLEEIVFPNSLDYLYGAFMNCFALKEVHFPEGVRSIGYSSFYNCTALAQVTIPSSVYWVGNGAFQQCSALRSITIKNPVPPDLGNNVFAGLDQALCTLIVPYGSKAAYEAAEVWNLFTIVEEDFSSIDQVENAAKTVIGYYNLTGQKLSKEPDSGLYILLYEDGTTEKRMKK